jgi:hypothetical protein
VPLSIAENRPMPFQLRYELRYASTPRGLRPRPLAELGVGTHGPASMWSPIVTLMPGQAERRYRD